MRVNKSNVADSQKMFISSGKKCNMFSKFWMAPSMHNFDKFSLEKTCFSFGQEAAFPSLSVVSHKRNLLIYISLEWCPVRCTFCNQLSEQCPLPRSSDRGIGYLLRFAFFGFSSRKYIATIAMEPPSWAEGSGSITMASYNIRSGCNGGLESSLREMKLRGVDFGILLETKLTKGVCTRWSSGYNVQGTHAPNAWQGGISLFWRASDLYGVKGVELRVPNKLSFQLVTGAARYYIVGCHIPPNNLTTLTHVK